MLLISCLPSLAFAAASASPVTIDPAQSHVEISVKATVDSFIARLPDFAASITMDSQAGQVQAAVFRFNFAAIKTGNADRDHDMNDWQQTAQFPEVLFTLTALEPGAEGKSTARGRLRFHGIERPVSFPVLIERGKPIIAIDGDVTIDTREYGLPVIKKYLVLKVDPAVIVHFHLQGTVLPP